MHEIAHTVLPGETVFDIGAHTGNKTDWFVGRGARVIAVEPQPHIADVLRERFRGNANVTVIQKGLADAPGQMTMQINNRTPVISTFSPGWKTGRFKDYVWDEETSVEMTTLDRLVEAFGKPRYMKIDVEGFEKQVMLGLTQRAGALSIEFTSEFFRDARDILWYSRGLGYASYNYSLGESDRFARPGWAPIDAILVELEALCGADGEAWGDIYLV